MSSYSTKQRNILTDCLKQFADKQFTASEIAQLLKKENISKSAIYRNLKTLEDENMIIKCGTGKDRETLYRYTGSEECKSCLHLSCKNCGKTYHMKHDSADAFIKEVAKTDMFTVDKAETVIYGICNECKNKDK